MLNKILKQRLYSMNYRCTNEISTVYDYYGGKGIRVCEEWILNPNSFIEWSLQNGFEPGLEIDRIDGNKNYSPENCRWVTKTENLRNKKHNFGIGSKGRARSSKY